MTADLPLSSGLRIGLLGGSFNPAHAGHIHISLAARRALKLDQVWWLVSAHNPLKEKSDLQDYAQRLEYARTLTAARKFIHVTDLEARLGTQYTVDTLGAIKKKFPRTHFVWLMGADNLATFHRWKGWPQIFRLMPMLVLDRAPYSHGSLRSKAALRFAAHNVGKKGQGIMVNASLPAWGYLHMRLHGASATMIRKKLTNAQ